MKKQATPDTQNQTDTSLEPTASSEPFWTMDIKILLAVNIIFLAIIMAGLIWAFKTLTPGLLHHAESWWNSLPDTLRLK